MAFGNKKHGNENIKEDFIYEKSIEEATARVMCALKCFDSYEVAPADKRFSFYDFAIRKENVEIRFELKRTSKDQDTGNIFLELESARTGKQSSIYITQANFWIEYIEPRKLLAITTPAKLRSLIARHPEFKRIDYAGGGTVGVLVPIPVFMDELKPTIVPVCKNFGRN